jgi:hypothetical protein
MGWFDWSHFMERLYMAKKKPARKEGEKSISATIREIVAANPKMKAKEVAEQASKTTGKKVAVNLVYLVKSGTKNKATKKAKATGMKTVGSDAKLAAAIVRGMRFVEASGNIQEARKILDLLESAQ